MDHMFSNKISQFIRRPVSVLTLLLLLAMLPVQIYAQEIAEPIDATKLAWETDELRDGVVWKKYLGDDLFDARLSINIIEVDVNSAGVGFEIAYVQNELIKTSTFAERSDAIAAINGSFFNVEAGGAVVFLKVDGEIIADGAVGRNPYTENGAVGWGDDGKPVILEKPQDGWHSVNLENLMGSGPLLISNGAVKNFNNDPFNQNRHPRSAVARTSDGRFLMITVDGRSFQSYGMTIPELAQFLSDLDAVDALNLDGGGSTALWIKEKNVDGIVNYPSDNLEFDHEGERGVSNAIILIEQ